MTRKTKKFSLGVKIASILSCLALTAVGFASWLILKPAQTVNRSGSFEVYTVEENNLSITVTPENNTTITWGKDDRVAASSDWLIAQDDVKAQNLTATFNVTVESNPMNLDEVISATRVVFDMKNALSAYQAAVTNGIIAMPTITVNGADANIDYDDLATNGIITVDVDPKASVKSMSFTVVVTFAWGTNGNPYTYYNGLTYSAENAEAAKTALGLVYQLNDKTFALSFNTVPKG